MILFGMYNYFYHIYADLQYKMYILEIKMKELEKTMTDLSFEPTLMF